MVLWTLLDVSGWPWKRQLVPMAGVEPARLTALPPQDSVSTNSTTSAIIDFDIVEAYPVSHYSTRNPASIDYSGIAGTSESEVTGSVS